MRVLIDTNIFIYREDDHVVPKELSELFRIFTKIKIEVLVHPGSIKELERDKDKERKRKILSKIEAYNILESPPNPVTDKVYMDLLPPSKRTHDDLDNVILYSVYRNAVDFLITEDKGIHKKASRLGLGDRVFLINEAIEFFKRYLPEIKISSPPAIRKEYVYNVDINDTIFDSLKEEYGYDEFVSWFERISTAGRKCWIHYREDGSIGAILIYKLEDEALPTKPPFPKKRRVKIATMKVTHVGHKIGELFIKLSVDLAVNNNIKEIYLTHFTKEEDYLVDLILEYGFEKVAVKYNGEDVYLKRLVVEDIKNFSPLEISQKYYPSFYDGGNVRKFVIPIRPEYHDRLFTDYPRRQTKITEHMGEFIIEGNTIKKAYLCHSKITRIRKGDIILFYRSGDLKSITSIGVIEAVYTQVDNAEQIINYVGKRTVYTRDEIEEMAKTPTTVILFRHHFHFREALDLDLLKDCEILKGAPQSITEISHENYLKIKRRGGTDERFTVN